MEKRASYSMKTKDLKISTQISIVQYIFIILALSSGVFQYFSVQALIKNSETFRQHPIETQAAISSLKEDIYNIRLKMEEVILGGEESTLQANKQAMDTYEADILTKIDILSISYLGPPSDLEALRSGILTLQVVRTETLRLQSDGLIEEAKQRLLVGGIFEVQVTKIIGSANVMETFAKNKANELYLASQKLGSQVLQIFLTLIVVFILSVSLILLWLRYNTLGPLNKLKQSIDDFKLGKLETRVLNESKNEIGIISNSFNTMAEVIESENQHKINRVNELNHLNKELSDSIMEREQQTAELIIVNRELGHLVEEKELRATELLIVNKELKFQTEEKVKRAAELIAAKSEISTQAQLILMQKAYYLDKQLFEATLLSIGDAVISCDKKSNIVFINRAAELLTGWKQEEAIGLQIEKVFNIVHEITHEKCENIIDQVILAKSTMEIGLHTILVGRDGSEKPIEDSAAPIFDENKELAGAVLVFRDVTLQREAINSLEYLGYHDKLTDLYNRRFYEEEIKRLDTSRNLPLTIIMGDVNGLKLINDSFGHSAGDELLQKAAKSIKQGCRSDDIIARMGGDEFVAILPKTSKAEAEIIISRIQASLSEDKIDNIPISVSFGHGTKENEDQD
ncbi:MAG: diguanylate cyclase, partial [Erysipelotrichaceae bacterium]